MASCALKANYLGYSFDETARLKVESVSIVEKAHQRYGKWKPKADSVLNGVKRAYEDASLRNKNQASMREWETILDSTQGSLAGTLKRWRENDTLSGEEIEAARKTISADFDRISKLENNKSK